MCPTACGGMPWAPGFPETVVMTERNTSVGSSPTSYQEAKTQGGRQLRLLFFVARAQVSGDLLNYVGFVDFLRQKKKTAENRINMDKQRGRERKSSRP